MCRYAWRGLYQKPHACSQILLYAYMCTLCVTPAHARCQTQWTGVNHNRFGWTCIALLVLPPSYCNVSGSSSTRTWRSSGIRCEDIYKHKSSVHIVTLLLKDQSHNAHWHRSSYIDANLDEFCFYSVRGNQLTARQTEDRLLLFTSLANYRTTVSARPRDHILFRRCPSLSCV